MAVVSHASTYWTSAKPAPGYKGQGDPISTDTFLAMIDVLESMAVHSHTMDDQYTTVCQCQCDCSCGKGLICLLDNAMSDISDIIF